MLNFHMLEQSHNLISEAKVGDGHGFYAVVLGLVIGSILLQVPSFQPCLVVSYSSECSQCDLPLYDDNDDHNDDDGEVMWSSLASSLQASCCRSHRVNIMSSQSSWCDLPPLIRWWWWTNMNFVYHQVLVGILFLILGGLDINDADHQKTANILNNTATVIKQRI